MSFSMEDNYCKSIYCSGHASMMIVCLCELDEINNNVLFPYLNFESHSSRILWSSLFLKQRHLT